MDLSSNPNVFEKHSLLIVVLLKGKISESEDR